MKQNTMEVGKFKWLVPFLARFPQWSTFQVGKKKLKYVQKIPRVLNIAKSWFCCQMDDMIPRNCCAATKVTLLVKSKNVLFSGAPTKCNEENETKSMDKNYLRFFLFRFISKSNDFSEHGKLKSWEKRLIKEISSKFPVILILFKKQSEKELFTNLYQINWNCEKNTNKLFTSWFCSSN